MKRLQRQSTTGCCLEYKDQAGGEKLQECEEDAASAQDKRTNLNRPLEQDLVPTGRRREGIITCNDDDDGDGVIMTPLIMTMKLNDANRKSILQKESENQSPQSFSHTSIRPTT